MKRTLWALVVVLGAGLLVAELAMDLTPPDRRQLYLVFALMAMATLPPRRSHCGWRRDCPHYGPA